MNKSPYTVCLSECGGKVCMWLVKAARTSKTHNKAQYKSRHNESPVPHVIVSY